MTAARTPCAITLCSCAFFNLRGAKPSFASFSITVPRTPNISGTDVVAISRFALSTASTASAYYCPLLASVITILSGLSMALVNSKNTACFVIGFHATPSGLLASCSAFSAGVFHLNLNGRSRSSVS